MSSALSIELLALLWRSFLETFAMVAVSGLLGSLIGLPLGVYLHLTDQAGILENRSINSLIGGIVNSVRSVPFIILLVAIIPLTRLIAGSSIGTAAAIVPLTVATAPFVARLVETALREVDRGLVEAALAMGASTSQVIFKVLIPEAMPGIVAGITISLVSLTSFSAMAGAIGGGGLGDLGIRYGYRPANADEVLQAAQRVLAGQMRDCEVLNSPQVVRDFLRVKLGALEHEVFAVIHLDAQNRVIEYVEMFRGTVSQTSVYPREVVKESLARNSAALLLVHNHPSGSTQPSRADEMLTQALKS